MKTIIKSYWNILKSEYQAKYDEPIFTNYEKSKPFVERFKLYLEDKLKENPSDVDVICALATVMQELRYEQKGIKLLEDFIETYEMELSNQNKARIYTNLAFYYDGCKERIQYLLQAEALNSPFLETYKGLGQYYFSKYQYDDSIDDLEKALKVYEKLLQMTDCYEAKLGYTVCLFELGKYQEAKKGFQELLEDYPDRMRLLIALAYCEIYLGNKEKAMYYLSMVRSGEDPNYQLITDEIGDFELIDALYVLGEYEMFLAECEKALVEYYLEDGDYYYYALWITGRKETFEQKVKEQKDRMVEWIEETKVDEDFEDEEQRQGYLNSYEKELKRLIKNEHQIKYENYKPTVKLNLCPEYRCYLVDCIRHSF